jgi:hypothetical protein
MIDKKDKKIDDELLEDVVGGKFLFSDRLFGKKNEDDKKLNVSDNIPGQRVTTPETIMRA